MGELFSVPYELLLDRRTYDIFAAYWPNAENGPDGAIAKQFNAIAKHVATHRPESLTWNDSRPLGADAVGALRALKGGEGPMLLTQGSSELVHLLLENDLADELRVLTFPVVLGKGKRLFGDRSAPGAWRLNASTVSPSGVVMLVPAMLRARVPAARIGFFLHVPFPSPDVFRILPPAAALAEGVLGADLVGFHTDGYRRNFIDAAVETVGAERRVGGVRHAGRNIAVQVHPIAVDARDFVMRAQTPSTVARVEEIRREAGGRKILLGIDRLDYTKGIPRRLLAFDRLLTDSPELRSEVLFIQVAVPTRERVDSLRGAPASRERARRAHQCPPRDGHFLAARAALSKRSPRRAGGALPRRRRHDGDAGP